MICAAIWIVKQLGDEKVAAGTRRLLKIVDDGLQMPDVGPDWYVRPMATIWMTLTGVVAAYFFVLTVAAASVMTQGNPDKLRMATLGVVLSGCSMCLCLRTARSSYEVLRRRSAKRRNSAQRLVHDTRLDSRRGF